MFMVQHGKEDNCRMTKVNEARRRNYQARRASIVKRFNELVSTRIEGIRLDFEGVISKLASENYLSEKSIKNILKS